MREFGFQAERGIEQYVLGRSQRRARKSWGSRRWSFRSGSSTPYRHRNSKRCSSRRSPSSTKPRPLERHGRSVARRRARKLERRATRRFRRIPGLYETIVTKRNRRVGSDSRANARGRAAAPRRRRRPAPRRRRQRHRATAGTRPQRRARALVAHLGAHSGGLTPRPFRSLPCPSRNRGSATREECRPIWCPAGFPRRDGPRLRRK